MVTAANRLRSEFWYRRRIRSEFENVKMSENWSDEKPGMVLKQVTKSATRRRCSSDWMCDLLGVRCMWDCQGQEGEYSVTDQHRKLRDGCVIFKRLTPWGQQTFDERQKQRTLPVVVIQRVRVVRWEEMNANWSDLMIDQISLGKFEHALTQFLAFLGPDLWPVSGELSKREWC